MFLDAGVQVRTEAGAGEPETTDEALVSAPADTRATAVLVDLGDDELLAIGQRLMFEVAGAPGEVVKIDDAVEARYEAGGVGERAQSQRGRAVEPAAPGPPGGRADPGAAPSGLRGGPPQASWRRCDGGDRCVRRRRGAGPLPTGECVRRVAGAGPARSRPGPTPLTAYHSSAARPRAVSSRAPVSRVCTAHDPPGGSRPPAPSGLIGVIVLLSCHPAGSGASACRARRMPSERPSPSSNMRGAVEVLWIRGV